MQENFFSEIFSVQFIFFLKTFFVVNFIYFFLKYFCTKKLFSFNVYAVILCIDKKSFSSCRLLFPYYFFAIKKWFSSRNMTLWITFLKKML